MKNKVAAIVGGGDSAMQEALTLAEFASKTIIINQADALTGQSAYRERIEAKPKIEIHNNTVVEEILGDAAVTGLKIKSGGGDASQIETSGVFVYIGLAPGDRFFSTARPSSTPRAPCPPMGRCARNSRACFAAGTVRAGAHGRAAASAGDGATRCNNRRPVPQGRPVAFLGESR